MKKKNGVKIIQTAGYNGARTVCEYSFCQCIGLMHGLTEIEKKVMSFQITPFYSSSQTQGAKNWLSKGAILASCNSLDLADVSLEKSCKNKQKQEK